MELTAKASHDEARKNHACVRKGANAKAIVNLWRFLSSRLPHDCEWREYAAFENLVRWRAIQQLRQIVGFPENSGDDIA